MRGGSRLFLSLLLLLLLPVLPLLCWGAADPGCGSGPPCPPWSSCVEHPGGATCRCEPGFTPSTDRGCVPARTFPGLLTPRDPKAVAVSPVLEVDLPRLPSPPPRSSSASWGPWTSTWPRPSWSRSMSLCELQPCDPISTVCLPQEGVALCACRPGFRSAHPMDRTCTACRPGSRLRDGVCERCPFGFSGFECEEPLLLALVLVSCCGGALLLLLLLLLLLGGRSRRPPPPPPSPLPDLGALQFPARGLSLPRVQPCGTPEVEHPEPPPPARMETFLAHRGGPAGRGEDRDYF
ncbi:uncharacterized protein [Anas platyrhynchos]|uniref:uncharacterized protein isoform X3 n=1 Tax=Anas platyrhynchos TaxID=8839 RepID=UPI003AF2F6D3